MGRSGRERVKEKKATVGLINPFPPRGPLRVILSDVRPVLAGLGEKGLMLFSWLNIEQDPEIPVQLIVNLY